MDSGNDDSPLGPDPFVELYKRRGGKITPGLARMQNALEYFEPCLLPRKSILVAGTNGKGTTAAYTAMLLAAAGRQVGLYTSPHLERYSERFTVIKGVGESPSTPSSEGSSKCQTNLLDKENKLHYLLARITQILPPQINDDLSFFELTTLLAFAYFKELKCNVVVLEVGLGGRFDATNVAQPLVSVITSIGLDHCEFLGSNLTDIAQEKAGVMRAGRPVLWSGWSTEAGYAAHNDACDYKSTFSDSIENTIDNAAQRSKAKLLILGQDWTRTNDHIAWSKDGYFSKLSGKSVTFPSPIKLQAEYLKQNFTIALAATIAWWKETGNISRLSELEKIMTASLQNFEAIPAPSCLLGRFEVIAQMRNGGYVILDVCHNPSGAAVFVDSYRRFKWTPGEEISRSRHHQSGRHQLERYRSQPVIIVSTFKDKDYTGIYRKLRQLGSEIYWIDSLGERALRIDRWAGKGSFVSLFDNLENALVNLAPKLRNGSQDLLLCGSVHMMGLWRPLIGQLLQTLDLISLSN